MNNKETMRLKKSIEKAEQIKTKNLIKKRKITDVMIIIENFIKDKELICYGGIAINNILPKELQFYSDDFYIPDYDFFSTKPLQDAKTLANKIYRAGFNDVEAKVGIHEGTFKIFVNFVPVADITYLHKDIFINLKKSSRILDKIHYAPPNYLRMSMYNELSQPKNDPSRWEKVFTRLKLLNKQYPILNYDCDLQYFQNKFESNDKSLYNIVKNLLIEEEVVFFGGYAFNLLSTHMSKTKTKRHYIDNPYFDVLSKNPKKCIKKIKDKLKSNNIDNIITTSIKGIQDILPKHYEIKINDIPICYIYIPNNCHSYNTIKMNNKIIKIATIDTIIGFYLKFLYINKPYYNKYRLLCMAHYLFKVQLKNKNKQQGILKRFVSECYGKQKTIQDIRKEKSINYKIYSKNKKSRKFLYSYFRYNPSKVLKKTKKNKKIKK